MSNIKTRRAHVTRQSDMWEEKGSVLLIVMIYKEYIGETNKIENKLTIGYRLVTFNLSFS